MSRNSPPVSATLSRVISPGRRPSAGRGKTDKPNINLCHDTEIRFICEKSIAICDVQH